MFKNYRFRFNIDSLALFLIIMLPNFIWFAIPAPNDILRTDSLTPLIDTIASVCQVLMIAALCILANREQKKRSLTPWMIGVLIFCLLYFISWGAYYASMTNTPVILGLTIPPCLAFMFFAIDRKNTIAVIPCVIFTLCHVIYAAVNFIV